MMCRKNLRTLVAEYNAAADKLNTALMKLKKAILALKRSLSSHLRRHRVRRDSPA